MKALFRKFLIIFILLIGGFNFSVFAETPTQAQLTRIEKELWGLSYDKEADAVRLNRIEKQVFGTQNSKLTPDKRVDKISKTLGIETYAEARSSLSDLYVGEKEGPGVEYPQIDRLESVLLGTTYKKENINTRLERLEKKVFGAKQQGELSQRTEALNRHANIKTYDTEHSERQAQRQIQSPIQEYGQYQSQRQQRYNYGADEADLKLQLSAIENAAFGMDYSQEPVSTRLSRLENRIFQRNFAEDDEQTRVARLQAAATARKTAKYYDNNRVQKYASTGLQAASFLLMILALIL